MPKVTEQVGRETGPKEPKLFTGMLHCHSINDLYIQTLPTTLPHPSSTAFLATLEGGGRGWEDVVLENLWDQK